jgi:hypothetical protein
VKTKLDHPAAARDLYASPLYRGRRAYVEATCDRWFILSAKHGLVAPDDVLEPYEETLKHKSVHAKRDWAAGVLAQLTESVDIPGTLFEVHAGAEYRNFGLVEGLRRWGATVEIPTEHLGQGEQLEFYSRPHPAAANQPSSASVDHRPSPRDARGSYAALAQHLRGLETSFTQLSFAEIEWLLGRPLPASARRYRAWWANESKGTHGQTAAWMGVSWLVDGVDFNRGIVRFRRGRR